MQAVLAEAVAAQGAELDTLTGALDDPAEVVSVAHRYFVRLARADPDWGWLLVRLDVSHNVLLEALGPFARRDLARGIRAGRFRVADKRTALFAAGGALLAVMRAVLDGQAPQEVERYHAEGILRLFGLSADRRGGGGRAPDADAAGLAPTPRAPSAALGGWCGCGSEAAARGDVGGERDAGFVEQDAAREERHEHDQEAHLQSRGGARAGRARGGCRSAPAGARSPRSAGHAAEQQRRRAPGPATARPSARSRSVPTGRPARCPGAPPGPGGWRRRSASRRRSRTTARG